MTIPFRPAYAVLGLPFDLVTLTEAEAQMRAVADAGERAILSTPNVNWIMLACDHALLRDSVLASRLSVVDGKPLVWLGRLLGVPFPERVSGSDLFVRLQHGTRRWTVFFLGGLGDVAQRAAIRLNQQALAMHCVGSINPGVGTVASMAGSEVLDAINASRPDLVVVSLGALRGQDWILRARPGLTAAWITHLGAVVNFVAGEVRRAPAWTGRLGLEWVWRIVQEPKLWKRYGSDGARLLGLVLTRVLPLLLWQRHYGRRRSPARLTALPDGAVRLQGAWHDAAAATLHDVLAREAAPSGPVVLDLGEVEYLGPAVVGQCMIWRGLLAGQGRRLVLRNPSVAAQRLLHAHLASYLLA